MLQCPNCNEMNEGTAETCMSCGAALPREGGGLVKKKKGKVQAVVSGDLSVSPKAIELIDLKRSEVKETYILLSRADFESDHFAGVIIPPNIPGFKVKSESFEGLRNVINIQIEAKELDVGQTYEDFIVIKSDIGEAKIPVKFGISPDSPQLGLDYNQLQINMLKKEKSAVFCVTNIGFGTLTGNIKTRTPWLNVDETSFALGKDSQAEIEVTIDKKELRKLDRAGRVTLDGTINLETNAGEEEIKIILYLPPRKTLDDFKKYIPFAVAGLVLLIIFYFTYPIIKQLLTPPQIPQTGLWGKMVGEHGSQFMKEQNWNPFSEDEKLVFTSLKNKEGQIAEIKLKKNSVKTNVIANYNMDRVYTPGCAPNGFLFAVGRSIPDQLTEMGKLKFMDLAIANENKQKPDVLTDYMVEAPTDISLSYDPAWSPDGMKLAFTKISSPDAYHGEVLLIDYNNAIPYSITNLPQQDINLIAKSPRWSPDGKKLIIEDLNKELYIIEPKGRDNPPIVFKLTSKDNFEAFCPDWSPDGKQIAFSRTAGEEGKDKGDIYIVKSDGTSLKELVRKPGSEELDPSWSPDGKYIAFSSKKYGADKRGDIYMMEVGGKELIQLTDTEDIDEKNPLWSPDGKKLVYLARDEESEDDTDWELYLIKPEEIIKGEDKDYKPLRLTDDDMDQSVPVWWHSDFYNRALELNDDKAEK